jgi:hypothetical protein
MATDMEILEAVCERMQQVGLVASKSDFSTRMLGKGPSYLTSMKARGRQVPKDVIAHLIQRLEDDVADRVTEIVILQSNLSCREGQQKHRRDLLKHLQGYMKRQASHSHEKMPDRDASDAFKNSWLQQINSRLHHLVAYVDIALRRRQVAMACQRHDDLRADA